MENIHLYTIGFTKKPAAYFFEKLRNTGIKRIIDIRLNNVSQLAGFAKKEDLKYFLQEICQIDYLHLSELAPTQDILDAYKKNKGDWKIYEKQFLELMEKRHIENKISKEVINNGCLLCSEDEPDYCHRRLVAEYLQKRWGNMKIDHLM